MDAVNELDRHGWIVRHGRGKLLLHKMYIQGHEFGGGQRAAKAGQQKTDPSVEPTLGHQRPNGDWYSSSHQIQNWIQPGQLAWPVFGGKLLAIARLAARRLGS